jgi:hypothetical protein
MAALMLLAAAAPTAAQSGWSSEPTFRWAGRYEAEWTAEAVELAAPRPPSGSRIVQRRPGVLRGAMTLDIGCDGAISGEARAQTQSPPWYQAWVDGPEGARSLEAILDLVGQASLAGTLGGRVAASQTSALDVALTGSLTASPTEEEPAPPPAPLQAWYASNPSGRWTILAGEPGYLSGAWDGAVALSLPADAYQPGLQIEAQGAWRARRVAVALCPWRGIARATGTLGNEQRHDEIAEFTFRPTGDGRLVGEGTAQAQVTGGTAGGCTYSGGGPFAVRVSGEQRDGRFRLRLDDDEHPQLLVTTVCGGNTHVGPQPALVTAFDWLEVSERAGTGAALDATRAASPLRGTLEVTLEPASGASPP